MGYAQLVIGPAGSGNHCETIGRSISIVNLDPAAENFDYPVAMDIKELISSDDVMEELGLGPNGALVYCMEHLEENLDDRFTEELESSLDNDYLVFDRPGQIGLFSHVPVLHNFVEHFKRKNFNVCAVYLLDSQFMTDVTKFLSGCMASLSAMVQLEVPHVNILSKIDLIANKRHIDKYLNTEPKLLLSELNERMAPRFKTLNKTLIELFEELLAHLRITSQQTCSCRISHHKRLHGVRGLQVTMVDDFGMVNFIPLDLRKESGIKYMLAQIDNSIRYGEDAEVKVRDFGPDDED